MPVIFQVALGGAIGAALRYLTVLFSMQMLGKNFPYGTMLVNMTGSFIMGLLSVYLLHRLGHDRYAPFLMTGLLGGFTTFSAFSLDTVALLEKGRVIAAGGYVAGSVGLSVLMLLAGVLLMRSILS
jgi:CrcB protein